jgi:hypothetical protein
MIMVVVIVVVLVIRLTVPKTHLASQARLREELERTIHGSEPYGRVFAVNQGVKVFTG